MDDSNLALEYSGNNAVEMVNNMLEQVVVEGEITRVCVEIDASSPIGLSEEGSSVLNVPGGPTTTENTDDDPDESADTTNTNPDETAETPVDVTTFQDDSSALKIASTLAKADDEFLDITEVRERYDEDEDFDSLDFSKILWDLANRGLVEKKAHPDDGRKKLYRVTEKGERSVKQANDD